MLSLQVNYSELPVSISQWKQQALSWAHLHHEVVAYYEPNGIPYRYGAFQNILGVRSHFTEENHPDQITSFSELRNQLSQKQEVPLLGILTYDLKNQLEQLHSSHPDNIGFPEMYFFRPEIWIEYQTDFLTIHSSTTSPQNILADINAILFFASFPENKLKTEPRVSKEEYVQTVERLREHILEGDVYEVNYCQEFYVENAAVEPASLFWQLNQASPTPFAGFLKLKDRYLLCASPERFLKKEGNQLISQPIKGTIRRGTSTEEDEAQKNALANSEKEKAENMMIVDLVRNDFSRVSLTGSVQVDELFGLYGFQFVWQMISTIKGEINPHLNAVDVLEATFPMGSMTGAPKIKALELIEQYEKTKRGLYSGSLGYFLPNGDFDFNVVIRSLQYNASSKYLSFEVGSAITYDSDPEQEYQECLLKASAIKRVLEDSNI